mmetsp:Transcript_29401/g.47473  ORF Transcript_29401/g.47473 Transcript_29401/m.47473 type:complete len:258 (-) Transcript_29401:1536-2309(-)
MRAQSLQKIYIATPYAPSLKGRQSLRYVARILQLLLTHAESVQSPYTDDGVFPSSYYEAPVGCHSYTSNLLCMQTVVCGDSEVPLVQLSPYSLIGEPPRNILLWLSSHSWYKGLSSTQCGQPVCRVEGEMGYRLRQVFDEGAHQQLRMGEHSDRTNVRHLSLRMGLGEELSRCLSEVVDLCNRSCLEHRISDGVYIDRALIRQIVEHIISRCRCLALLLVSKYQINPLVQVFANVSALQCLSMTQNKESRVSFCPRG